MTGPLQPETRRAVLDDGRTLAWTESGAPAGRAVFAFHGLPGSRLQQHPDTSIARAAGLRVIHVDRPGFGLSSPQRGRRLGDWPRDVAALADHLGLERFAVTGISGGGPYAVACAAVLGARITRAAVVSGVGPPGSMAGRMTVPTRLGFFLAPRAPWSLAGPLGAIAPLVARSPHRYLWLVAARLARSDGLILARPEVRAMFARDLPEAFHQGAHALVDDLALLARPWGLALERVACEVALWHGEDDRIIPPSAARHLERAISGAQARIVPCEGHFMVFDRWAEVCAWLGGGS